jgi:hypothetical protein
MVALNIKAVRTYLETQATEARKSQDEFNASAEKLIAEGGLEAFDRYSRQQTVGGRLSLASETVSDKFYDVSADTALAIGAELKKARAAVGNGFGKVAAVVARPFQGPSA